ncbi:large subunit ribosomal protein LP0 [Nematocida minor]|uniref:large subunit ribosomal protein LP0 n=1 Tax=Nematocida minor TaxID=1912983 RepID=UPI00221E68D6|nr:large subunit ribosomal protein LP0 [Nematocida minor]XP_051332027.1 large subunit ribosomal protein LP0 [Nematocida minor]KAI5188757.1 large subunit ribosomal protein LP0 [Nematocida minor]KAI5188861.1 large subunit ribosomal protein LP0 [Nematocida minor]
MLQVEQPIMTEKSIRKNSVYDRTQEYFTNYKKFMVVEMTNISSSQCQIIRQALRGKGEFLMGKNTTIKSALKKLIDAHPELKDVENVIKNNVGLVFTNGSLSEIENIFEEKKTHAVAKPGDLSQCDIWIEPIITGLDPGKTSFFQALGIATKITKGKIEILSKCKALTQGKRVGHSEAALLSLLGVTPFVYKMKITHAYSDGKFFDSEYLKITSETVESMVKEAVSTLAALALGAGYVTESTVSQELQLGAKNIMALAAGAGYSMPELTSLLK